MGGRIPAWRQRQLDDAEDRRERNRLGHVFGLDDDGELQTGKGAEPVTAFGAQWITERIEGFERVADLAQGGWLKTGNEANRLNAIDKGATLMLSRVRNVEPAAAAFGLERVWLEMFLERILDLAARERQPTGQYDGPNLEIRLRLVLEACELARRHLAILIVVDAAQAAPVDGSGRPLRPVDGEISEATFAADDF